MHGLPVKNALSCPSAELPSLTRSLFAQAAFDFKDAHKRVENPASGTLEQEATVTYGEMIEHGEILHSVFPLPASPLCVH
jgi:hypothetical protein